MTHATPQLQSCAPSRLESRLASLWFVSAAYLVLTIVMTWPLAMNFRSSLPKGAVDLWQNYWNFWWWKTALFELHTSPFRTSYLFHPSGAELVFYTHSIFNMIVSMPVNLLLGPAAAYNFCVLLALCTSGIGAFLLVRELTGDARAAFLAGAVFTFFPQHMEQTLEHLNLFSVQFIPLSAYFLLRMHRRCRREIDWKSVVGLGLSFALNALTDWHLGIMLMLLLVPIVFYLLLKTRAAATFFIRDMSIAAVIAGIITLPAVWPLVRGMLTGESFFQKPAEDKGIDALYLFLPSVHHPIWGSITRGLYMHRAYDSAGFLCFLGFVPLVLMIIAIVRRGPGFALWSAIFVGALLLSLGAHPYWHGQLYKRITLPFTVLSQFPLLRLLRIANRFMIPASLALAVLAGMGWHALKFKTDTKFVLLIGLIVLEFLWLPFPLQTLGFPGYYAKLAKSEANGAVLDIPFMTNGVTVRNMVAQTVHHRPIAGGYLSTVPPEPIEAITSDPALSNLVGLDPRLDRPIDIQHLRDLGFSTIIMHKEATDGYAARKRAESDPNDLFEQKVLSRMGGMKEENFEKILKQLKSVSGSLQFEDNDIIAFRIE